MITITKPDTAKKCTVFECFEKRIKKRKEETKAFCKCENILPDKEKNMQN